MQKTALVLGAGGFIGHHMVKRLKEEGYWVRGVDLKTPEYEASSADDFKIFDLRNTVGLNQIMTTPNRDTFDEIYQFAADMGGAEFVFTREHDADIMHNSACINLNIAHVQHKLNESLNVNKTKIFYSSSACAYSEDVQLDTDCPSLKESSAIPANPDSKYGWEKLFSELFFDAVMENWKIPVRIARYHNIFGPLGTWDGGREKSPAAACRKVALAKDGEDVLVFGDGNQTRSFLFIDECIEATRRLMKSDFVGPVNIGSDERVTINELHLMVASIAGKNVKLTHKIDSNALGVRGRNSDNTLYEEKIGWRVSQPLRVGLEKTYAWILEQAKKKYHS